MRYSLPVVQKLIAAPCEVPWSSMKGDDRKRHGAGARFHVHNLSAMTKEELQAFLHALVSSPENARLPCASTRGPMAPSSPRTAPSGSAPAVVGPSSPRRWGSAGSRSPRSPLSRCSREGPPPQRPSGAMTPSAPPRP